MIVIDNAMIDPPMGLQCISFGDSGFVDRFNCKPRKAQLQHIVLHETAGNTSQGCQRTLKKKKYGIHFILSRSGTLYNHNDLLLDAPIHANQLNQTSIGIEIVNPYAPSIAKLEQYETAPAEWWTWTPDKKDRRYVLPTVAQLIALEKLIPWICGLTNIPFVFPTADLNAKRRRIKNWFLRAKPAPGIVAHQDFSKHADGRYPLEYLIGKTKEVD